MPTRNWTIPLFQAFVKCRREQPAPTVLFYAVVGCVFVFIGAVFLSSDLQRLMLRRQHWNDSSFARWSVLQFVPSMYNFSNEIEFLHGNSKLQVNHFPLHAITFQHRNRRQLGEQNGTYRLRLQSHYRDVSVTTNYSLKIQSSVLRFEYDSQ